MLLIHLALHGRLGHLRRRLASVLKVVIPLRVFIEILQQRDFAQILQLVFEDILHGRKSLLLPQFSLNIAALVEFSRHYLWLDYEWRVRRAGFQGSNDRFKLSFFKRLQLIFHSALAQVLLIESSLGCHRLGQVGRKV